MALILFISWPPSTQESVESQIDILTKAAELVEGRAPGDARVRLHKSAQKRGKPQAASDRRLQVKEMRKQMETLLDAQHQISCLVTALRGLQGRQVFRHDSSCPGRLLTSGARSYAGSSTSDSTDFAAALEKLVAEASKSSAGQRKQSSAEMLQKFDRAVWVRGPALPPHSVFLPGLSAA